jgi:hypothetical protein
MYLFYKFFKKRRLHVFYISFVIFIFLNVVENYIHYNIGHHPEAKAIILTSPSLVEWTKIILVMLLFAFLQGFFTYLME